MDGRVIGNRLYIERQRLKFNSLARGEIAHGVENFSVIHFRLLMSRIFESEILSRVPGFPEAVFDVELVELRERVVGVL